MGLLALFPYRQFRLETCLSPTEVVARLAAATEAPRLIWLRSERMLQGEVRMERFAVLRIASWDYRPDRDVFRPRLRGQIIPTASGSVVEGSMTPHWFGMVWLSFLFAFTALCLLALCRAVVDGPPWRLDRLPGGVAVIGTMWLASAGKFAFEARWSLDLLREIVNTEHEVPADSALQEKVGE